MPIYDWTRVDAGVFHDFHLAWVVALQQSLNNGVLPRPYYVQIEPQPDSDGTKFESDAALDAIPAVERYALKRRTLVIRHASGDRVVALLESVSPGNKSARHAIRSFVEKAVEALYRGYHLLVVDLFPPTPRDPNGIHAAIWGEFSDDPYAPPPGDPLTLAAYSAGPQKRAYVEPTAVGRELLPMPLFLEPEVYVEVPLEETYRAAYRGVPWRWLEVLD